MPYLLFFLIGLLLNLNAKAQSHFEVLQAIKDSAYPLANYYLDKTPSSDFDEQMIRMKIFMLYELNNMDELCVQIKKAQRFGFEDDFVKFYSQFHCEKNYDKFPKELKNLFQLKKQTKENGFYYRFTKEDSLRGSDNVFRSCYNVNFYALDLRIDVNNRSIKGTVKMNFLWKSKANKVQIDAHRQLSIDSIRLADKKMSFSRSGDLIFIENTDHLKTDSLYSLDIFYHATPETAKLPPWEGGFVWEKNKKSEVWAGVACEHLGASFWWPCKDYQQDEPDSMSLSFEVQKPYKVISNGNKVNETTTADGYNRFTWKVSSPINNYNATFYIGNFTTLYKDFTDITGKLQKLQFYIMPYKEQEALEYFSFSSEVLKFYEKTFGEYPFWKDGYKLVESPYKGMEHQSAIAIGDGFRNKELKDVKCYEFIKDDYLILHETAHEWWGNSVTAFDMSDAWLQEGFATYSEFLFIENKYGNDIFIKELNRKRLFLLNKWPLLGSRGVNDNSFVGADIYHKGALLLQNIRSTIGKDSLFLSILKGFAIENKFKTVSTEDFLSYLQIKSGIDFTPLFHVYLKTLNSPTLEYELKVSDFGRKELSYRWTKVPEKFSMPFAVKINNNMYKKITATTEWQTIHFTAAENFNFFGSRMSYKGSPAHFYSHFNTIPKGR